MPSVPSVPSVSFRPFLPPVPFIRSFRLFLSFLSFRFRPFASFLPFPALPNAVYLSSGFTITTAATNTATAAATNTVSQALTHATRSKSEEVVPGVTPRYRQHIDSIAAHEWYNIFSQSKDIPVRSMQSVGVFQYKNRQSEGVCQYKIYSQSKDIPV
jgi:hypothetical protein